MSDMTKMSDMKWTNGAEDLLQKYLDFKGKEAENDGADPAEVKDDLREHLKMKAPQVCIGMVDVSGLKKVLGEMGEIDFLAYLKDGEKQDEDVKLKDPYAISTWGKICAIWLPLIVFLFEWGTGACASTFIDPIPTTLHKIIVFSVPVINFYALSSLKKSPRFQLLSFLNAFAFTVALVYALCFLPLSPFAFIGILWFGFGLLPLSPLFATFSTRRIRKRIQYLAEGDGIKIRHGLLGGLLAVGLVILAEGSFLLTDWALVKAASDNVEEAQNGVEWLRAVGSAEILEWKHDHPFVAARPHDALKFGRNNWHMAKNKDHIKKCYYLMTGNNIDNNDDLIGSAMSIRGRRRRRWDNDQGELTIGAKLDDLYLHSSRLDGSIDTEAALGYLEWTMEFRNNDDWDQAEARALINLPQGGVVSRLTLWINGEPQEAAFAGKRKVVEAYQRVVRRRRDPVLVTQAGEDKVLMQCFPVPAKGGIMKVRLGITFPMSVENLEAASCYMPNFAGENFQVPTALSHGLWVESKNKLTAEGVKSEFADRDGKSIFSISALIHRDFQKSLRIVGERPQKSVEAVSADLRNPGFVVKQEAKEEPLPELGRVAFLIDDSAPLEKFSAQIENLLKILPEQKGYTLFVTSNPEKAIVENVGKKALLTAYNELDFEYGNDNAPALMKTWDWCYKNNVKKMFWLHQPQYFKSAFTERLTQRMERAGGDVKIYNLVFGKGMERIGENLQGFAGFKSLSGPGGPVAAWKNLFANTEKQSHFVLERRRLKRDKKPTTSTHLARLWANEYIRKLIPLGEDYLAIKVASHYQLVTPVSGAVVLENQQQYKEAGLNQVSSESVPTIPEPEEWLLIIVSIAFLCFYIHRKRQTVRVA